MKILKKALALTLGVCQAAAMVVFAPAVSAVTPVSTVNTIAAGENHSLVVKTDNKLYGFGDNQYGQLGSADYFTEKQTKLMDDVVATAAAPNTSFAIKTDGSLWGFGDNSNLLIPTASGYAVSTPTKIMDGVVQVSASRTHVLAITKDGSLYGWGNNNYGQLLSLSSSQKPQKLMDNVISAASGNYFSLAVTSDGKAYSFGDNTYGQLGTGYTDSQSSKFSVMSNVKMVAAGSNHSLFLKEDGSVYACGDNSSGQIGSTYAYDNAETPLKLSITASSIYAGGNVSAAINSSGTLYTWGENSMGQLHSGSDDFVSTPKSVTSSVIAFATGGNHSLMLKSGGSLSTAGSGGYGQLGQIVASSKELSPKNVMSGVYKISFGANHAVAIRDDGSLLVWGDNSSRQIGQSANSVSSPTKLKYRDIGFVDAWAKANYTILLGDDGKFYGLGENGSYQLGNGRSSNASSPVENPYLEGASSIRLGNNHGLALIGSDIYGWGTNSSGELGLLPRAATIPNNLSLGLSVLAYGIGDSHSAFLDASGDVYSLGSNSQGQLGVNNSSIRSTSTPVKVVAESKERIRNGTKIETIVTVAKFTDISVGSNHTLAIDTEGNVWGWGNNSYGQLGDNGSVVKEPVKVGIKAEFIYAGDNYSAFISSGNLYTAGKNDSGQLGNGSTGASKSLSQKIASNILDVSLGSSFAGYTDISGRLYTWGSNDKGQLGNSKSASKPTPVNVTSGVLTSAYKYITGLKLEKTTLSLAPDATETLKVTVEPSDAAQTSLTWKSSNTLVATVTNGTVKAIRAGTTTITVSAGSVSAQCKVTVELPVTSITVKYTEKNIKVGKSFLLGAKAVPSNSTAKSLKYSSSDTSVATVTTYGKVVGKSAGDAVITVTAPSGVKATCKVHVSPKKPGTPKKPTLTSVSSGISITVKTPSKAVDGIQVWRREGKTGKYVLVEERTTTKGFSFIDDGVTKGKTYYYKVKTYRLDGDEKVLSNYSSPKKVKKK